MRPDVGLNVTTWGTGDPAVLVHGSFGRGEATWKEQRPLAESHRLLLVDRRGFGGSPSAGSVDFDLDADDVASLLEQDAHLVGHRVRTLVVRGDWRDTPPRARELGRAALHAVCDVLERELGAASATLPAAHNPQLLGPPFNDCVRSFWESV